MSQQPRASYVAEGGSRMQTYDEHGVSRKSLYKPLDITKQEIRLLKLLPAGDPMEPIEASLLTVSLEGDLPSFSALSYRWGSSDADQSIVIDNIPFRVRSNLWEMLDSLSQEFEYGNTFLWIDYICIDHQNAVEQAAQVKLMANIYRRAENIILGLRSHSVVSKVKTSCRSVLARNASTSDNRYETHVSRLPVVAISAFERLDSYRGTEDMSTNWDESVLLLCFYLYGMEKGSTVAMKGSDKALAASRASQRLRAFYQTGCVDTDGESLHLSRHDLQSRYGTGKQGFDLAKLQRLAWLNEDLDVIRSLSLGKGDSTFAPFMFSWLIRLHLEGNVLLSSADSFNEMRRLCRNMQGLSHSVGSEFFKSVVIYQRHESRNVDIVATTRAAIDISAFIVSKLRCQESLHSDDKSLELAVAAVENAPGLFRTREIESSLGTGGFGQVNKDLKEWLLAVQLDTAFLPKDGKKLADKIDHIPGPAYDKDMIKRNQDSGLPRYWERLLPADPVLRHFAIRSVCCVCASFRPLQVPELFEAATTRIFPTDPSWPTQADQDRPDHHRLMRSCDKILRSDAIDRVFFKSNSMSHALAEAVSSLADDSHHFMALVCLEQLKMMGKTLLLTPWKSFRLLRKKFVLHSYVVTFWQYHYRVAEKNVPSLTGQLQMLLESAWTAQKLGADHDSDSHVEPDLSPEAHAESKDLCLAFCDTYGFQRLRETYIQLGARPTAKRGLRKYKLSHTDRGHDHDSDAWQHVDFSDLL